MRGRGVEERVHRHTLCVGPSPGQAFRAAELDPGRRSGEEVRILTEDCRELIEIDDAPELAEVLRSVGPGVPTHKVILEITAQKVFEYKILMEQDWT
jgi:hypothetical protein